MKLCLTAAFVIFITAYSPSCFAATYGSSPGTLAPEFTLFDTCGNRISLSDYKDKYVILNFWAFWCDTWKKEMPSLLELSNHASSDNFSLVAISVDGSRLPVFQQLTNGINIPFPVLLDDRGTVSRRYSVCRVPTVIIVNPAGRIVYSTYSYPGNHVLLAALHKIESREQPNRINQ